MFKKYEHLGEVAKDVPIEIIVTDPRMEGYPVFEGEDSNTVYAFFYYTQKKVYNEVYPQNHDVLLRNINLLLKKGYSANMIMRAIAYCSTISKYPFSTKLVSKELAEWAKKKN